VPEELGAGEVQMAEHDQVREVRTGEKERARVGEKQAAVQERCLAFAAAARGVDEHGGEERDRGVEI